MTDDERIFYDKTIRAMQLDLRRGLRLMADRLPDGAVHYVCVFIGVDGQITFGMSSGSESLQKNILDAGREALDRLHALDGYEVIELK